MDGVLLTGCAGFIASRVAELLLDQGKTVVGIDNLNDYTDPALKRHRLQSLEKYGNFSFQQIDLEDQPSIDRLFAQNTFAAVVNLAARAGVRYSIENPHVYMTTNVIGGLNLLQAMHRHSVKKYVLASTSSLYAGLPMPFVESLSVNQPISPYAASKKAAEAIAYTYHHLYGIDVSVVRYFTVYGPAGRPDMATFRFIKWIHSGTPIKVYGDGNQSRDFTYIDDIAVGTLAALRPLGYEVINLGGGNRPVSINHLIEQLEHLLGKKAIIDYQPFHSADMRSTWADIEKAGSLLNWKPNVSLVQGLRLCVEWYRDHLPWANSIKIQSPSSRQPRSAA